MYRDYTPLSDRITIIRPNLGHRSSVQITDWSRYILWSTSFLCVSIRPQNANLLGSWVLVHFKYGRSWIKLAFQNMCRGIYLVTNFRSFVITTIVINPSQLVIAPAGHWNCTVRGPLKVVFSVYQLLTSTPGCKCVLFFLNILMFSFLFLLLKVLRFVLLSRTFDLLERPSLTIIVFISHCYYYYCPLA